MRLKCWRCAPLPSDPVILAFDTSAAHCAAALLCGGEIVASAREDMARGQAERLFGLLEEVLAAGGKGWDDLTALAVGVGPGNFTGIRIAVSAARGLALGLGIPAVGVSTLEAQVDGMARPCLSVLDARRGMNYVQRFGEDGPSAAEVLEGEAELPDLPTARDGSAAELVPVMARIAAARLLSGEVIAAPAPMYVRAADAAPPRDPAPTILPGGPEG